MRIVIFVIINTNITKLSVIKYFSNVLNRQNPEDFVYGKQFLRCIVVFIRNIYIVMSTGCYM